MNGDSLIRFGDSTFYMDLNDYNIFTGGGNNVNCLLCGPAMYTGIALGYPNTVSGSVNFHTSSIAIGYGNNVNNGIAFGSYNNLNNGLAFGNTNNVNNGGFMVVGAGITNDITGSIMIGNSISNKPAITIIPDNSGNTAGFVGIGTTSPNAYLTYCGKTMKIKIFTLIISLLFPYGRKSNIRNNHHYPLLNWIFLFLEVRNKRKVQLVSLAPDNFWPCT